MKVGLNLELEAILAQDVISLLAFYNGGEEEAMLHLNVTLLFIQAALEKVADLVDENLDVSEASKKAIDDISLIAGKIAENVPR